METEQKKSNELYYYNTLADSAHWFVNKRLTHYYNCIYVAIVIADLISKDEEYEEGRCSDSPYDDWFPALYETLVKDTGLKKQHIIQAIKNLKQDGVLNTKMKGIPTKQYFKINHKQIKYILSTTQNKKYDNAN